jgi:hypothetical protein
MNKNCTKCGQGKTISEFGPSKQRKDGLRPWCKVCHNAANAKWRLANSNYYIARHDESPDRRKKYDAAYKKKNPTYLKEYYEANKHEFIGRVNKRRSKAEYATPSWADKNKMRLMYRLASNLNRLHGFAKYHVDHIVPLQGKRVSGLHVHNNLRILSALENKSKFNKWEI